MLTRSRRLDRRQRAVGVDVTGAGTVPQFADSVSDGSWRLIFFVRIGSEIVCMAAGAIRFVRRGRPCCGLRVRRMAVCTRDAGAVVARIVGGIVREPDRRPRHSRVTVVALKRCHEMRWRLAGRADSIVTGRARTRHRRVIEICRRPRDSAVARIALRRRLNMRRRFAGRLRAVVTA